MYIQSRKGLQCPITTNLVFFNQFLNFGQGVSYRYHLRVKQILFKKQLKNFLIFLDFIFQWVFGQVFCKCKLKNYNFNNLNSTFKAFYTNLADNQSFFVASLFLLVCLQRKVFGEPKHQCSPEEKSRTNTFDTILLMLCRGPNYDACQQECSPQESQKFSEYLTLSYFHN